MGGHFQIFSATGAIVALCVVFHFEILQLISFLMKRLAKLHRTRIVLLIFGILLIHLAQVTIFAFGYYFFRNNPDVGHVGGMPLGFQDYVYFSFATFTTLGYGDLVPAGPVRFIAAVEALSGLVFIAWSGSFTFIEMQRFWKER